ncbi:MAG: rhamnogalacturonan acetylesterase [Pyrinomonadaceae bacterium]
MASEFLKGVAASLALALFAASLPATRAAGARAERAATAGLKYDFGPGKVGEGYRQVLPETLYTKERGYGFEPGPRVTCLDRGGDAVRGDFCTSETPFHFSVALPEGNYDVTVTLGDREGESVTTVKAELRRLMLEEVRTGRGRVESRTFTVNVRTPRIPAGGEVKLKERERKTEAWAWDEKLTLEFNNARPAVAAVEIRRTDDAPTLFLLGDSTVCDQPGEPYNSWGQMLPRFFRAGLAVANHAQSGESLRSSAGARRLEKVLSAMRRGDYLFIQFGHNDEKERGEGVGAFTTYKASLGRYVEEARGRGATVVLVTPVQRRTFDASGKIKDSHGDYDDAVRQTATELGVPLIDLHRMSARFYEALGPDESKKAFAPGDGTHHNNYGSYELARAIVEGIRATRLGLARHLAKDARPFDPARPDPLAGFRIPASPVNTEVKPLGN